MVFVGLHRGQLVEQLRLTFEHAVASRTLAFVTVESPPGWGKTRIIQELYGQLAFRQPRPSYWPPSLDPADRKRVFPPTVTPPVGARPPWFWWGWSCHRLNGKPAFAAGDADEVGLLPSSWVTARSCKSPLRPIANSWAARWSHGGSPLPIPHRRDSKDFEPDRVSAPLALGSITSNEWGYTPLHLGTRRLWTLSARNG